MFITPSIFELVPDDFHLSAAAFNRQTGDLQVPNKDLPVLHTWSSLMRCDRSQSGPECSMFSIVQFNSEKLVLNLAFSVLFFLRAFKSPVPWFVAVVAYYRSGFSLGSRRCCRCWRGVGAETILSLLLFGLHFATCGSKSAVNTLFVVWSVCQGMRYVFFY